MIQQRYERTETDKKTLILKGQASFEKDPYKLGLTLDTVDSDTHQNRR